ncbi:MAG TPA: hypothetical protein V6D18_17095 [Thermosynechococcaceae cyanobacterium]
MKFVLRPLRFLLTFCFCALLWVAYTAPSFAVPATGEPNPSANRAAKAYERVSREPLEAGKPGPNLKEAQAKTSDGGLNEVQGKAGLEEMNRPSNSGGSPTVEKRIEKALEGAQGKVEGIIK